MFDQDRPYGRVALHFEYRPEDHDDGEKEFLGRRGRFNGEDIIDIICEQQATVSSTALAVLRSTPAMRSSWWTTATTVFNVSLLTVSSWAGLARRDQIRASSTSRGASV